MKKTESTNYAIKSKLLAAVVMLLVATIMVVSSTYAWFTLSTAPEVTGISTAVGANGALEMLLATKNAEGEWVYGTGSVNNKSVIERNTYWGNLVNLDDHSYGSQAINLYPSVLNLNDGRLDLNAPLQMPDFGADGRFEDFTSGGSFAKYNSNDFMEDSSYFGFRGLGVASGLTQRQKAFRTAISSMSTAAYNAQNEARKSLSENGTPLANIAILKALNSADSKVYTKENVSAIGSMISGIETALKQAEEAYVQAIIAYSLGKNLNHESDSEAISLAGIIKTTADDQNAELDARLNAIFALLENSDFDTAAIKNVLYGYETYQSTVTDVKEAKTAFDAIADADADKYSWTDIREALTKIVNVDSITINGIDADKVTEDANKNQIASDIMAGKGVQVVIPTGGGVYADIADLCGNYTVDIEIDASSLNVGIKEPLPIKATMSAKSTNAKPYLTQVSETINAPENKPAGDTAGDLPLTELYGYVIDLAFRTNAAQSNLLLQTDAKDRIYSDKTGNSETMGSGSTMTFKSSSPVFTTENVKNLMSNLRVVFYSTEAENNMAEIYATAKLDVNDVLEDANGVTAKLYIYRTKTLTKATMTVDADPTAEAVTLYKLDGKYYTSTACLSTEEVSDFTGKTVIDGTETVQVEFRDNVITSLDQNQEKHISVLVYLDGTNIENSHVAADVATSMTGSMNLQFASSATLVPMEYGDLHD